MLCKNTFGHKIIFISKYIHSCSPGKLEQSTQKRDESSKLFKATDTLASTLQEAYKGEVVEMKDRNWEVKTIILGKKKPTNIISRKYLV